MKDLILISRKFNDLKLQIFPEDNSFGLLDWAKNDDDSFYIDNEVFAYEMLKLLKEAEKRGCFDKLKEEVEEDREEIII